MRRYSKTAETPLSTAKHRHRIMHAASGEAKLAQDFKNRTAFDGTQNNDTAPIHSELVSRLSISSSSQQPPFLGFFSCLRKAIHSTFLTSSMYDSQIACSVDLDDSFCLGHLALWDPSSILRRRTKQVIIESWPTTISGHLRQLHWWIPSK
jgi:hypothetical protein